MKLHLALVAPLAFFAAGCATAAFPRVDTAEQLRAEAAAVVERYASRVRAAGFTPSYVPVVRVQTAAGLIFFTREERSITVPLWPEVPEEARAIFTHLGGGDAAEGERLFRALFNWFFIPHEATHWLREEYGAELDHYASEVEANDLAVAFWAGDAANEPRLALLEALLERVVRRMPDPTPAGMSPREYFNTRYEELGQDPMKYGYFQFKFALDSLRRRSQLDFAAEVRRVVGARRSA